MKNTPSAEDENGQNIKISHFSALKTKTNFGRPPESKLRHFHLPQPAGI